jgi:hypothetical protein
MRARGRLLKKPSRRVSRAEKTSFFKTACEQKRTSRVLFRHPACLLMLGSALVGACRGREAASGGELGPASARGAVVARVDGAPIGLDEVRELCERTGLAPRAALERLVDERLLVRAALARGYQQSSQVAQEGQRAEVQALLAAEVERGNAPPEIPLAEARERFDRVAARDKLEPATFASYEHEIRAQLSSERKQAALERLITAARKSVDVRLDEAKVQTLLSDPALWGGGS